MPIVKKENIKINTIKIALAGNPNCGKTTLFNQLTGSRQYVGNWPGVTVEKKEGLMNFQGKNINVLDLPGVYSLSPYSSEEIVTRNCLLRESPDLIINIVDATNLERNLYLTTQILELKRPTIVAVNMIDILEKRGCRLDFKYISKKLGVPVIPISASKGIGINEMMTLAISYCKAKKEMLDIDMFPSDIELVINEIKQCLEQDNIKLKLPSRWLALKFFEGDKLVLESVNLSKRAYEKILKSKDKVKLEKNTDYQMMIADYRYKYICDIWKNTMKVVDAKKNISMTDKIDKVVTNRYLSLPIFICIMLFIFYITFGPIGTFFKDYMEQLIKVDFSEFVSSSLSNMGASNWAKDLIVGGVINGVGSVISFFPQIVILFTLLSILEDSGYMARAAFIMDGLLRKIGLTGRAFVPMLMGFGCTVPAVMGARILEEERDRRLTILITPFMSCSAKMPVYLMIISAFFPYHRTLAVISIYLLGIIIAILTSLLFKKTILKGPESSFIMELPDYRMPSLKNLFLHVFEKVKDFIVKAGTVLVGATVIIWFLQSFDFSLHMVSNSEDSMLAIIGTFIAPIFGLCGFNDWRISVALLTGLIAKESIVSTMAVLYGFGQGVSLSSALVAQFSPINAYALMVFILLYTPCVAALAAIKKEMKSVKWTAFSVVYQFSVAWFMSALVYQISNFVFNVL